MTLFRASLMGFPMGLLDVGGGLGIDYDGSRSAYESSMNYSMEVYARDVVANVKQICEESKVELPDIVSESGRALVAPHSILIFEAVDRITRDDGKVDTDLDGLIECNCSHCYRKGLVLNFVCIGVISARACSRRRNFCTLPVTVIGNSSTKRKCRGTL